MPTHADAMAQTLAGRGVRFAFGLPGGEVVAFLDACRQAGVRFLLAGHESSAACMAQVVGQMTGVPGLCVATLGPGATNLITGVANAWLDRAPMLAVTAQIPSRAMDTLTHQRLPLDKLFGAVTKGSFSISGQDAVEIVECGMDLASAPRPGPVHIALPSDVAVEEYAGHKEAAHVLGPIVDSAATVDEIAARLNASERPLVLLGLATTPAVREL